MRKVVLATTIVVILSLVVGVVAAGYFVNTQIVDNNIMTGAIGTSEINSRSSYVNYAALYFQGHPGNVVRFCATATLVSAGRALRSGQTCGQSWYGQSRWYTLISGTNRPTVQRNNSYVQYSINWSYVVPGTTISLKTGSTSFRVPIR